MSSVALTRTGRLAILRLGLALERRLAVTRRIVIPRLALALAVRLGLWLVGTEGRAGTFVAIRAGGWTGVRGTAQIRHAIQPLDAHAAFQRLVLADGLHEAVGVFRSDLHEGLVLLHLDSTDLALAEPAIAAQHGNQPARFGILLAAHRKREPDSRPEFAARRARSDRKFLARLAIARLATAIGLDRHFGNVFRRGMLGAVEADEGSGELVDAMGRNQPFGQRTLIIARRQRKDRIGQQALIVAARHFLGRRRTRPGGGHGSTGQQALGLAALVDGYDQRADALATGAAGTARTVQQRLGIGRQIGMDDELEARQVDAAGCDVCRHANTGTPVAHCLQRMRPLILGQFAGKGDDGEIAVNEPGRQMIDGSARGAEHNGVLRFIITQHVDDGIFTVRRRDGQRAIFDIAMLLFLGRGGNAHGIALVALGELGNGRGHRGRKHQRAAVFRRTFQNEFEVFAKAEIEHLVGFIQHDGAQGGNVERIAADVVADTAGRTDNDVRATLQSPALVADIHTADTACDDCAGQLIEPFQFAHDLHGQFAGWGDDHGERRFRTAERIAASQKRWRHRDTKGNGLA